MAAREHPDAPERGLTWRQQTWYRRIGASALSASLETELEHPARRGGTGVDRATLIVCRALPPSA